MLELKDRRIVHVTTTITPTEYAVLQRVVKRAGGSLSAWVRDVLLTAAARAALDGDGVASPSTNDD
jgi:hypothetical protein